MFQGEDVVMRLSDGTHNVNGLVLDASLTLSRLDIISSNASGHAFISSNASTLLEVRAGAPPVMLQGLEFDGQVRIESSTEFAGCHFGSTSVRQGRRLQAGTEVRALLVSNGYVSISDTVFEDLLGGAIVVSGGSLAVHTSTFRSNRAESGGALLVTGGKVTVRNSTFTDNEATTRRPENGGAIRVIGTNASLELADLTVITGSVGVGGSVASDIEWTHRLPAPLAHYVSNPEQNGIAQNSAGTYDYDYPIPCAAALHGIGHHNSLAPPSDPPCLAMSGLARLPWAQLAPMHSESAASASAAREPHRWLYDDVLLACSTSEMAILCTQVRKQL